MTRRTGLSTLAFLAVLAAVIALALTYPANANAADPPTPPNAVRAFPEFNNTGNIAVIWTAGANYDTQIVLRREPGGDWVEVATLGANALSWIDTNVVPGTKYIYRIKVENDTTGKSKISYAKASAIIEGGGAPPRDLRAYPRVGGVVLKWSPGTKPGYVGQAVYRRARGVNSGDWEEIYTTSDTALATYTDETAALGQKYTYYIEADRAHGSDDRSGRATASSKYPPGGLTATVESGAVVLTWTPGANPAYVRQVVQRRVKGEEWATIHTISDMTTSTWTDSTVVSGTRYLYTVKAQKANGKGGGAKRVSITVP